MKYSLPDITSWMVSKQSSNCVIYQDCGRTKKIEEELCVVWSNCQWYGIRIRRLRNSTAELIQSLFNPDWVSGANGMFSDLLDSFHISSLSLCKRAHMQCLERGGALKKNLGGWLNEPSVFHIHSGKDFFKCYLREMVAVWGFLVVQGQLWSLLMLQQGPPVTN